MVSQENSVCVLNTWSQWENWAEDWNKMGTLVFFPGNNKGNVQTQEKVWNVLSWKNTEGFFVERIWSQYRMVWPDWKQKGEQYFDGAEDDGISKQLRNTNLVGLGNYVCFFTHKEEGNVTLSDKKYLYDLNTW